MRPTFSVVTVELVEFEKLPVQNQDFIENYQSIKRKLQNIQNSPECKKKKPPKVVNWMAFKTLGSGLSIYAPKSPETLADTVVTCMCWTS